MDSVDISSSIENDHDIEHITDTEKADSVDISSFIENDPELENIIDTENANSVDISSSIENCPKIEHIIDTDPHYTKKNKEHTERKTLGTADNVDISSFIENDPEKENITDTDQHFNMPDKEDTKSKTKGDITEVSDGHLDEKKSVFINEPSQPIIQQYSPQKFGKETYKRDFQPDWFKSYPWLSYSIEKKEASCYACEHFSTSDPFILKNWKKYERLKKHAQSESHYDAMIKWISAKRNEKQKSTILSQLDSHHKATVLKNRQYLKVIIETLMFTAQQNTSQRGHEEDRHNISEISDINRGNLLELLSLRCRDFPWMDTCFGKVRKIYSVDFTENSK